MQSPPPEDEFALGSPPGFSGTEPPTTGSPFVAFSPAGENDGGDDGEFTKNRNLRANDFGNSHFIPT